MAIKIECYRAIPAEQFLTEQEAREEQLLKEAQEVTTSWGEQLSFIAAQIQQYDPDLSRAQVYKRALLVMGERMGAFPPVRYPKSDN
jgi:hypothetical protein